MGVESGAMGAEYARGIIVGRGDLTGGTVTGGGGAGAKKGAVGDGEVGGIGGIIGEI